MGVKMNLRQAMGGFSRIPGGGGDMKVYCFWLNGQVEVEEAALHFSPTNEICKSCGACMATLAKEAERARDLHLHLASDPRTLFDRAFLQQLVNKAEELSSMLMSRLAQMEAR